MTVISGSRSADERLMSQVLRRAFVGLEAALRAVDRRASPGAVHQARVAARWLGDAATAFPGADLAALEHESHHLKAALGRMRDLQLRGASGAALGRAEEKLHLAMARWRGERRTLLGQLDRSGAPSAAHRRRALRRRLTHLRARIQKLPPDVPPGLAHRLRLKMKRARTVTQVLAPAQAHLLRALKDCARLLGVLHDFDEGLGGAGKTRRKWTRVVRASLENTSRQLDVFLARA